MKTFFWNKTCRRSYVDKTDNTTDYCNIQVLIDMPADTSINGAVNAPISVNRGEAGIAIPSGAPLPTLRRRLEGGEEVVYRHAGSGSNVINRLLINATRSRTSTRSSGSPSALPVVARSLFDILIL